MLIFLDASHSVSEMLSNVDCVSNRSADDSVGSAIEEEVLPSEVNISNASVSSGNKDSMTSGLPRFMLAFVSYSFFQFLLLSTSTM